MTALNSRDNPRVRRWRKLVRDSRRRREENRALIEGPHLLAAYLDAGGRPKVLIVSATAVKRPEIAALTARAGIAPVTVSDSVFRAIADTDAPAGIAAEIALPAAASPTESLASCVLLDAVQDAGNVGAILRSAAAFDIHDAILGPGCADPWSPKVLRAAMGAHFAIRITQSRDLAAEAPRFAGRLVCGMPRGGIPVYDAELPQQPGWLFGAEGQGVSAALAARASHRVSIPMAGGCESLNVAAALAICLYEWRRRLGKPGAGS